MHKNKCVDKPKEKIMMDGKISIHNKNVHSNAPKVVLFWGAFICCEIGNWPERYHRCWGLDFVVARDVDVGELARESAHEGPVNNCHHTLPCPASESSLQPLGLSLNLKLAISARLTS